MKISPDGNVLRKVGIRSKNPKDDPVEDNCPDCEVCRRGDREHCLLLCDACDLPYHCDCLDPPLSRMPIEEWFCVQCASVIAQMGEGALPSTSQPRRVIPRTKASESVRRRVQSKRTLMNSRSIHPEERTYPHPIGEVVNLDRTKAVGNNVKGGKADATSQKKHKRRKQKKPDAGINEDSSPRSQAAECATVPDKPGKPIVKGQTHPTFFKMAWECPKEDGGCPVTEYNLEMDSGKGFESIYYGDELEHMCENLMPGKSYTFRVQCSSLGGKSVFSDIGVVVTLPIVPGKCEIPKVVGKPKAKSIHVKWANPEYDGGTEVLGFEIEVIHPDGSTRTVFIESGSGTDWFVTGLLPGQAYKFRVKAYNIVGAGPWSDSLDAESGGGAPEPPLDVRIMPLSPHRVLACWAKPFHGRAPISEYRLQSKYNDREFELVYSGSTCFAKVKSLIPGTMYYFRVQAVNSAGAGPFSKRVSCQTPPSSPGAVTTTSIRMVVGATAISLWWEEPSSHGAPILSYNVEIGDALYAADGESPERRVEGLIPETTYKVRVQAVNSVGPGPFSSPVDLVTRGLPPLPPTLKCYKTFPDSLQLKWGGGRNLLKAFTLEQENPQTKKFTPVYQGLGNTFKVKRLQEFTSYNFRIHASNEEGDGPSSDVFSFTTERALPQVQKGPKVSNIKGTCNVEWPKAIGEDVLSCKLPLGKKELDFHVTSTKTRLPPTCIENNLQPAKGHTAKPLGLCTGTAMPDVRSKPGPSSLGSSSEGYFPLFDELMNYNFNEPVTVPWTSTSTTWSLPKKSRIPAVPLNLLDSILAGQEELHKKSNNVVLRPDGSFDLKAATETSNPSNSVVRLGSCKPSVSSKHVPPVRTRSSSSSLPHGALTKKKSSESHSSTRQKPRTNSSGSAKGISDETRKIQRKEVRHTAVRGNSCLLSKKSVDFYSKHREKATGILSASHKNLSTKSCDAHLASVPTSFPNLPDNKKQFKKSHKAKPSNMQNTVPDHGLDISAKPNASATRHSGGSSPQSSLSNESNSLSSCNVQKLRQCSTVVKGTSPPTNEIQIKDEPLSSDKEEEHSESQIGQADKFSSRTLKPDFRSSESLLRNSGTDQLSSTTSNASTFPDSSECRVPTPTLIKEEPVSSDEESTIPSSENCDVLSIRAEIKKESEALSEDVLNPLTQAAESFEDLPTMQSAGASKDLPCIRCIEDLLCTLAAKIPKSKLPSDDHPKTFIPPQLFSNHSSLKCSKALVEDSHLSAQKTPNVSAQEISVSVKCETENSTPGSKQGDKMVHNLLNRQLLEDEVKQLLTLLCNKVNTARKVMGTHKSLPQVITSVSARRSLVPKPINKRTCSFEQVKQHFNLEEPQNNNLSNTAINSKSSTQLKSVIETESNFSTDSASEHLSKLRTVQPSTTMLSNKVHASPHENSSKGLAKMTRDCKSKKTYNNLLRTLSYSKLIKSSVNKETLQVVPHIEVNAANKSTRSFHYSREQPIGNKSNSEKQNKRIENNKGKQRNLHSNKYSEKGHGKESNFERKSKLKEKDGGGRKESNSNENKRKTDKEHLCSKEISDNHAVKDGTARNLDGKNNYADKEKRDGRVSIPNNKNKHVEKNKHSKIERNLHSKNKYSKRDEHGNKEQSSASNSIHLDKGKYGSKESSFHKKNKHFENNEHDKKEKCNEAVKKKHDEKDKHDSKDRNLYNENKHVEIDNRVNNYDRKENCNKERVSYLKIKHYEKEHCNVKESKCDSNNKPVLEYSKDSYCDSTTKNREKNKRNSERDSDKKNKYTEKIKFNNSESNFVEDGTFIRERKRPVEASSINFSSDKSNPEYKRRKMSTEVNKQNSSTSSKSCLIPDSTSGPDKTERLAVCGSSKHDKTLLDARIQKLVNQDYFDIQSRRKRRHESMGSVDSNGRFSDVSQLSNEVLLNSGVIPFNSPILEKAVEQKHSASSLKGSLRDGRREGFRRSQSLSSTQETGQSNLRSHGHHGRRDSKKGGKGRSRFSSNTQSNHSNPNSCQELAFAEWAAERRKYFGDYNDYSAPLNQQDWTDQSRPNPYSDWSRPLNVVPVDIFSRGGMGHHSRGHWQHNWNELHGQRNYYAPFHQQDRAGRSHHNTYSDRSRPSNAVPVDRFPRGAEGGMGHQRQVHWR